MTAGRLPVPVAATVLALLGVRAGERVLAVGCGDGMPARAAAAAAGAHGVVLAVEADVEAAADGGRGWRDGVRPLVAAPTRLPLAAAGVDKAIGPMPPAAESAAVLHELARVLAATGRLVTWAYDGPGPDDLADPADPADRLAGAGFRLTHDVAVEVPPDGGRVRCIAAVPVRR